MPKYYRHLEPADRFQIQLLLAQGNSQNAIAKLIGFTGQIVREGSSVPNIVHAGQPAAYAALDAIVAAYKQRHAQESVLRVRSPARVAI